MLFHILKFSCIFFALVLIFANQNPIYSVLSLVALFLSGSIILLLIGVDFLPYIFIIVYAGAIAVLFLFVVIILKIKLSSANTNFRTILFISSLAFFLTFLGYYPNYNSSPDESNARIWAEEYYIFDTSSNVVNLGKLLYTEYNLHFIIGGIILLVAIIGAIILTRRSVSNKKTLSLYQKLYKQKTRSSFIGRVSLTKKK
jgi:NADH-quinone oxidoreductase subunit J